MSWRWVEKSRGAATLVGNMALEEDEYGRRGMDDSNISKQELTGLGSGLDIEAESETWRKLGCPDSINSEMDGIHFKVLVE